MKIEEKLQERLKLKFMADCKCGNCQCIPDDIIKEAIAEIVRLREIEWMYQQLNE